MMIADFLSPDHLYWGLHAHGKDDLLEELAQKSSIALGLDQKRILVALRKREALGSTGIGHGIAQPHARFDEIERPFGLLVRLRSPIDFDAIDERPVDLVVLLVLPANPQSQQLNALACVSRHLRDDKKVTAVRTARDAAGLYAALCEDAPINRDRA